MTRVNFVLSLLNQCGYCCVSSVAAVASRSTKKHSFRTESEQSQQNLNWKEKSLRKLKKIRPKQRDVKTDVVDPPNIKTISTFLFIYIFRKYKIVSLLCLFFTITNYIIFDRQITEFAYCISFFAWFAFCVDKFNHLYTKFWESDKNGRKMLFTVLFMTKSDAKRQINSKYPPGITFHFYTGRTRKTIEKKRRINKHNRKKELHFWRSYASYTLHNTISITHYHGLHGAV